MDSNPDSDISLLEISGEDDDSLLQHLPQLQSNHLPESFSLVSPIKGLNGSLDHGKFMSSSPRNIGNKENLNLYKVEVLPKLSMEPLQMKRKKKGGGYNLRKSLAWDKAFFTEEGVLDPVELEIISGTVSSSPRRGLSVICEGGDKSSSCESQCHTTDKQVPEISPPKVSSRLSSENEKVKKISAVKHDSSAHDNSVSSSVVLRNVFATPGGNKNRLRHGGCPRPLPSSSLKRPANATPGKYASKETKLPKIAAAKPVSCLAPRNTKSTSGDSRNFNYNETAQPAINIKKNVERRSSCINVKNVQNGRSRSESWLIKSPTSRIKGNSAESHAEAHSLSGPCQLPVNQMESTKLEVPHHGADSSRISISSVNQGRSSAREGSSLRDTVVTGLSVHTPYSQAMKPSGLRMPSPSLGFFDQHKTSVSHSSSQKDAKYSIPVMRKTFNVRLPRPPPAESPKAIDTITAHEYTLLSNSASDCTVSSPGILSSEKDKRDLEENKAQKVSMEVVHSAESTEMISVKDAIHNITNIDYNMHDTVLQGCSDVQMNGKEQFLQANGCEYVAKDDNLLKNSFSCGESKDSSRSDRKKTMPILQQSCTTDIGLYTGEDTISQPREKERLCASSASCHLFDSESCDGCTVFRGAQTAGSNLLNFPEIKEGKSNSSERPAENHIGDMNSSSLFLESSGITDFKPADPTTIRGGYEINLDHSHAAAVPETSMENSEGRNTLFGCRIMDTPAQTGSTDVQCIEQSDLGVISGESEKNDAVNVDALLVKNNGEVEKKDVIAIDAVLEKNNSGDDAICQVQAFMGESMDHTDRLGAISGESEKKDAVDVNAVLVKNIGELEKKDVIAVDAVLEKNNNGADDAFCQVSMDHTDRLDGDCNEDASSDNLKIDPSSGNHKPSIHRSASYNVAVSGNLIPLEVDTTDKDNKVCMGDTLNVYAAICSFNDDISLLVENDQNSSRRTSLEANSLTKCLSPDKRATGMPEDTVSSCDESRHELNNTSSLSKDDNQTAHTDCKKSENGTQRGKCLFMPPRDAVPFSDEWLAAIESAGEDIMTMKGGAVQNSPPDKSQPEPSPWSPVKKKHNQIGPFDCTKFTNTGPDSH